MSRPRLHVSNHAVERFIERHRPGATPQRARATLEKRLHKATRHFPKGRRVASRDRRRYFKNGDLVFAVDLETRTVTTVYHRGWERQPTPGTSPSSR